MPLPVDDSLVSYPDGTTSGLGTVLSVTVSDQHTFVLTDETPFHPVDPRWPDQGPDRGSVRHGEYSAPVVDCLVGATDGERLFVGDQVPVRRGEPGWGFVVVHVLAGDVRARFAEGEQVQLTVDAGLRRQLSAGHTGCHVASLALNEVLADRWRKPVAADGLGQPNFDQLAIVSSRITLDGAVDRYRIGKSLRKKGFEAAGLGDALAEIAESANAVLVGWVASGASVEVRVTGPRLTDLREWVCVLPTGTVQIPCGGTHLRSLAEVDQIRIGLTFDEPAGELVMTTTVVRPG
ncbi:MAG: metal-dependent hydrolase [Nakamurella sp.]